MNRNSSISILLGLVFCISLVSCKKDPDEFQTADNTAKLKTSGDAITVQVKGGGPAIIWPDTSSLVRDNRGGQSILWPDTTRRR